MWTGHVRHGSDIDIHVFTDSLGLLTGTLDEHGLTYDIERKRVIKHGEERHFTHIHVADRYRFELTVYAEDKAHYVFKSSITGKAIERASIAELEAFLQAEDPEADLDGEVESLEDHVDRFELYRMLLQPLEGVKQSPKYHPEGEALVPQPSGLRAGAERPYDEEFQLAALLHDVGKAIDPANHVTAALQALEGTITDRTARLIAHHMEAQAYRDGTLGAARDPPGPARGFRRPDAPQRVRPPRARGRGLRGRAVRGARRPPEPRRRAGRRGVTVS